MSFFNPATELNHELALEEVIEFEMTNNHYNNCCRMPFINEDRH